MKVNEFDIFINELKSSTYYSAADKIRKWSQSKADLIADWGNTMEEKEEYQKLNTLKYNL